MQDEILNSMKGKIVKEISSWSDITDGWRNGITVGDTQVKFVMTDGTKYRMYHEQNCCESVQIEDVIGDVDDLSNSPLLMAEVVSNSLTDEELSGNEAGIWTFYKFATAKGYVTLRWLGTSNGYYSVGVDVILVDPKNIYER